MMKSNFLHIFCNRYNFRLIEKIAWKFILHIVFLYTEGILGLLKSKNNVAERTEFGSKRIKSHFTLL